MKWLKRLWQRLFATAHTDQVQVIGKGEPTNPIPDAAKIEKPQWNAPWVFANIDLLGRNETDPALNARYVPEWQHEGLNYKTLAGNDHAWCSLCVNADLRKVKIKGTDNAGASSWSKFGKECDYWFGAILPIQHWKGGRHVCRFLYWIDKHNGICATLDGNKNNHFAVNETWLCSGHDGVVPSPRWPLNWPDGVSVSKEQVLAVYPWMVPGSAGTTGSTR